MGRREFGLLDVYAADSIGMHWSDEPFRGPTLPGLYEVAKDWSAVLCVVDDFGDYVPVLDIGE